MGTVHAATHRRHLLLGAVDNGIHVGEGGTKPVQRTLGKVAVLGDAVTHRRVGDLQQNCPPCPGQQNAFCSHVGKSTHHAHTLPESRPPASPRIALDQEAP
ncbi:hypothetical protein D9M68_944330 [compost metagenome]